MLTRELAARARGGAAVAHVARSHRLDRSETMSEDAALPLSFGLPREASARPRSEPSASRPEPPSTARPAPLGEFLSFAAAPPLPAAPSAWDADDEVCRDETNWCEARRFGGNGAALLLHEEILDFWAAFRPTASEEAARAGAVARVRALASELWPRSRVASFGSYSTGLHLPTSDIDLAVLGTGLRKSKDEKVRALRQLAAAVRRAPWETRSLEVVATAKVPILRFDDDATNVSIDVCIEEEDGLKSSALCRKVPPPSPKHAPHHHRHHHRRRRRRRRCHHHCHHCRHRPLRNPTRRPPPSRRSATSYSC